MFDIRGDSHRDPGSTSTSSDLARRLSGIARRVPRKVGPMRLHAVRRPPMTMQAAARPTRTMTPLGTGCAADVDTDMDTSFARAFPNLEPARLPLVRLSLWSGSVSTPGGGAGFTRLR